jgi:cation diffusion facilitator family transporter
MGAASNDGTRFSNQRVITARQAQQEKSLLRATLLDSAMFLLFILSAFASGSLTALAEVLRGAPLLTIEVISLVTMLRSHRGKFAEFEYGIGKIERVITIVIAAGLFFAAVFAVKHSLERISVPAALPTPGMIFAVAVASINMTVNFFCVGDFLRANEEEESLILDAQLKARTVKTLASVVVVVVLVLATWLPDPKAATLVDAVGAFFAAVYMVITAWKLVQESLPDLMDRALPEQEQLLLLSVVARYFDDFDQFESIRSRRSGGKAFIDMDLEFDSEMPLHEVDRRCGAIREAVLELIPGSHVTVSPRVSVWPGPEPSKA